MADPACVFSSCRCARGARFLRGNDVNRLPHEPDCACQRCHERVFALTPATRVTLDAPTGSLDGRAVSLRELVDNATLTQSPRYSIGEDWNDD